ncbi:MAG: hypothetical protein KGQ81_08730 [Cyanobacteria bacterium REEB498]|nr:hypothetical protein [Cyanobacteria bacterium REEB498]
MEMVRLGLRGEPARELCRPQPPGAPLGLDASFSGSTPCQREARRIRIDEPPGWPPLPPPPP